MKSKVALVRSENPGDGVSPALDRLGFHLKRKISKHPWILVKINFVVTNNELATTPLLAVKNLVSWLRKFYRGKVVIVEEATSGNTAKAFEKYGFVRLAHEDGNIEIQNSGNGPVETREVEYKGVRIKLPLSKIYLDAPYIVSICRAKTHNEVVVTLAAKNLLVGGIRHGMFKTRFRIHIGNKLNQILVGLSGHLWPDLAIIDGSVGMEGNGPGDGTPIHSGWVIASTDTLAADSLAANLMGFDCNDIGYMMMLAEKERGVLYPSGNVEIAGDRLDLLRRPYQPHPGFDKQREWRKLLAVGVRDES